MNDLNDTVFAKIIRGEIPCYKIYEDGVFLAILDIYPANPGHCLILPKAQAADIFDLPNEVCAKILPLAKRIAAAIMAATDCDGVNILQNNGAAAGQEIFYYHLHIIPRYEKDGIRIKTSSSAAALGAKQAKVFQEKIIESLEV